MTRRILVIEDNEANRDLMTYLLKAFGHVPLIARDGEEGLEIARTQEPDLILCDLQLPVLDGYAVADQLRQDEQLKEIPRIAVTAFAMVGDGEKVLAAGFDGYISKPIDPESFVAQLQTFLIQSPQAKRPKDPTDLPP